MQNGIVVKSKVKKIQKLTNFKILQDFLGGPVAKALRS